MKLTIEKYILANIWYLVHWNDPNEDKSMFITVANRIGELEDELRGLGVSEKAIIHLQDKAKLIIKTPIDRFDRSMQEKLSKVIFGVNTKWY